MIYVRFCAINFVYPPRVPIVSILPISTIPGKPKIRQYKVITITRNICNGSSICVFIGFSNHCPSLIEEQPRVGFDKVVFDLGQFFFGCVVIKNYEFPDGSIGA